MKFRFFSFAATLFLLWVAAIAVGASDQATDKDSTSQPASAAEAVENPGAVVPELKYEFDPVVDGIEITHDYVIKNTGNGPLTIHKVKTG